MELKELREQLKVRGATWSIPDRLVAEPDDEKTIIKHALGALPTPAGMRTARLPRIRPPAGAPIRPWQPGIFPTLRPPIPLMPAAWDWRQVNGKNWMTQPRNQGACGSCVAFAALGAVESHWAIQQGTANPKIDLSEAALFFANNRQCFIGDPRRGWWVPPALDYLVDEGACYEYSLPYRPVNQTADLLEGTERTLKIQGYDGTSSVVQMKRWLVEDGPLVATFDVYADFDYYWDGGAVGVYHHIMGAYRGGHAILVVGYDDKQSCWICKNSWGANDGDRGYFRIKYGDCNIDDRMYLIQNTYEVFTHDEIAYNPRTLRIVDEGANGWLLTDGNSRMEMFDNKEDAHNGLLVARRHTRQGFIGRDNNRGAKRIDYITEYWTGASGLPYEPLTKTDIIAYNPQNVVAEDRDTAGWRLQEGNHWMLLADDFNDALAVLYWVERHTRMCFIGRNNTRPNRKSYIMTYWE